MRKSGLIFFVIITAFVLNNSTAYGNFTEVASVTKLDPGKQIVGDLATYTLDVPTAWRKYIMLERSTSPNSGTIIEKVSFYYKPAALSSAAELLMEFSVFKKSGWDEGLGFIKISETVKHVFAYRLRAINPFVFGSDRLIFENYKKEVSGPSFFKDHADVPTEEDESVRDSITVNGKRISSKSFVNPLKVVFVPIREISEELGYDVGWNPIDGTVTVSNDSFYTSLGRTSNTSQKYSIILVEQKSYVSTMFFLQILKCGVEIDQLGNVRITKEIK